MEENQKEGQWEDRAPAATTRWLVILSVVLFGAAIFAGAYAIQQNSAVSDLKQQNSAMNTATQQLKGEVDSLTTKLAQMTAPPPAAPAADQTASATSPNAKPAARRTNSAQDRRMKQMQTQLTEQQSQLKQTQADLETAKSDLEGKLGSTRDELNGSIARSHDELVALEKRGERMYYEFDLNKSKQFQHEGPIQVSLRKADAKHQHYDLMMLVNDHQLSKKNVDLYEPIWLHESDMPQPVQVVVNQINKDHIHGYVSAPKYKESELSANVGQQQTGNAATSSNSSPTSPTPTNTNSQTPTSNSATTSQGQ